VHKCLPATFCNQFVFLVVSPVKKFDDARTGTLVGRTLAKDLGSAMNGIVLEQGVRKLDIGHT